MRQDDRNQPPTTWRAEKPYVLTHRRKACNAQREPAMEVDKLFAGSIPELYDRLLVPLIFQPYATDLAERLAALDPQSVLETAAGTGVLTRAIASRLSARVRIVATDLNQPMLGLAAAKQPDASRIDWRQADALA